LKLARFYRDGELSEIRVSNSDDAVFEVKNLFASEQLAEDAIKDMIGTKNYGQMSHVDELRLDFNRICRRRDIQQMTRLGFYSFKDSAEFKGKFSVDTILNIKNEQRYLTACFSDYVILTSRFGSKKMGEPYLFASLKNGYFYLLNADELPPSNPIMHSVKNFFAWILKKISFKTSTK
jgi:hypothetical protein